MNPFFSHSNHLHPGANFPVPYKYYTCAYACMSYSDQNPIVKVKADVLYHIMLPFSFLKIEPNTFNIKKCSIMDWQIICKKYMYICFEPNISMMPDKGSAQTSLVTPSTYQEVLKVLSIVIRRGHILLLAQPCQHLLHISQVLMQLDRLLQFGPPSSREGLETRPLLVQLGLGMRHNNSQQ